MRVGVGHQAGHGGAAGAHGERLAEARAAQDGGHLGNQRAHDICVGGRVRAAGRQRARVRRRAPLLEIRKVQRGLPHARARPPPSSDRAEPRGASAFRHAIHARWLLVAQLKACSQPGACAAALAATAALHGTGGAHMRAPARAGAARAGARPAHSPSACPSACLQRPARRPRLSRRGPAAHLLGARQRERGPAAAGRHRGLKVRVHGRQHRQHLRHGPSQGANTGRPCASPAVLPAAAAAWAAMLAAPRASLPSEYIVGLLEVYVPSLNMHSATVDTLQRPCAQHGKGQTKPVRACRRAGLQQA